MSDTPGRDPSTDAWVVEEPGLDPERASIYEALFTVGNGRLGTRGSLEEGHRGQLSGTYLNGVYGGHDVPVINLVNVPDWVDTTVFVDGIRVDGIRLDVDTCTVVAHQRVLDLRDGLLTRTTVFEDTDGRRTRLDTVRCASMADRRICALRIEVTPENHSSEIRIESGINGDRRNLERLPLYPEGTVFAPETRWEKWARARHLRESSRSAEGDALYLQMRTIDTGVDLGFAAATAFDPPPQHRLVRQRSERITEQTLHRAAPGETVRMDSRFWVERVEPAWDGTGYELRQIMGPDEFHSHIDNNAFTNRLAQWHLEQAVSLYDELRGQYPDTLTDVASRIGLKPEERDRWQEVADGLVAARQREGVIEQFTGYFERDDVPITEWDENNMPRYPKGYHHFNCETTKLLKQPDVVQLIYLLPDEFDARTKKANFDYYEARTLHKSSLSPCIHAIIGIEVGDTTRAVQYFERSALVDLTDNQGNTAEGIHLRWRGRPIRVTVDRDHIEVLLGGPDGGTEEIAVSGKSVRLTANTPVQIPRESSHRTPPRPPSSERPE